MTYLHIHTLASSNQRDGIADTQECKPYVDVRGLDLEAVSGKQINTAKPGHPAHRRVRNWSGSSLKDCRVITSFDPHCLSSAAKGQRRGACRSWRYLGPSSAFRAIRTATRAHVPPPIFIKPSQPARLVRTAPSNRDLFLTCSVDEMGGDESAFCDPHGTKTENG